MNVKTMGIQHSNMTMSNPATAMWGHDDRSSPKSCPNQKQIMSRLQRLDSVGEDSNNFFQLPYIQSNEFGNILNKLKHELEDTSFKTSCRFRESQSKRLSPPIPIAASNDFSRQGFCDKNKYKFLKSHSLPEETSDGNCGTMQQYKANRSWSFGSCGKEQMLYKEKSCSNFMNLKTKPGILSAVSGSCTAVLKLNIDLDDLECVFINQNVETDTINTKSSKELTNTKIHRNCKLEEEVPRKNISPSYMQNNNTCTNNAASKVERQPSEKGYSNEMEPLVAKDIKTNCFPQIERPHIKDFDCASGAESILKGSTKEHGVCSSLGSANLSSVLFLPRKTSKKGRPSSKKQRKRKRQKQKEGPNYSIHAGHDDSLKKADCDNFVCSSDSNHIDSVISVDNSPDACFSQNVSTPVKLDVSSQLPNVHCFFSTTASSESEVGESDLDEEEEDWFQSDESERACISPISGCGFSFALNLDSIFKQNHIPSLKSLLTPDYNDESEASPSKRNTSNVHFSVSVSLSDGDGMDDSISLSDGDSMDDSITFASSPAHSTVEGSDFALPQSKSQGEASGPVEDIYSGGLECLDADFMVDLQEANEKWDKVYSAPAPCSCCNKNSGILASNPPVKVQFVEGPGLSTVHAIGVEDRAGIWHHYALDRERFERRIEETSQVLSPILDGSHRSTIIRRNALLLEQREMSL